MKNQSRLSNIQTVNLQPATNSAPERESGHETTSFFSKVNVLALAVAIVLGLGAVQNASAGLVNGNFDDPDIRTLGCTSDAYGCFIQTPQSNIPGWTTTASDHLIEIWQNLGNVHAYSGIQHAELNATQVGTLYQDVSGIAAGDIVGWQFAHRGRYGVDVMAFVLTDLGSDGIYGTSDDSILFNQQFSDGNTAWGFYQGGGIVALGNTVRFSFVSVSSYGNNPEGGNFLDDADFGVGVGSTPEPGTLGLLGTGILGLGGYLRRRLLG